MSQVPGQPGLHRETLSQTNREKAKNSQSNKMNQKKKTPHILFLLLRYAYVHIYAIYIQIIVYTWFHIFRGIKNAASVHCALLNQGDWHFHHLVFSSY